MVLFRVYVVSVTPTFGTSEAGLWGLRHAGVPNVRLNVNLFGQRRSAVANTLGLRSFRNAKIPFIPPNTPQILFWYIWRVVFLSEYLRSLLPVCTAYRDSSTQSDFEVTTARSEKYVCRDVTCGFSFRN